MRYDWVLIRSMASLSDVRIPRYRGQMGIDLRDYDWLYRISNATNLVIMFNRRIYLNSEPLRWACVD